MSRIHRLTRDERYEMLLAYAQGEKVAAIAARFNVNECYPRVLAARRGLPTRDVGRPIRKTATVTLLNNTITQDDVLSLSVIG